MPDVEVPVVVVGAGPVGLSTAMFLAHWGVRALVVEKRSAISELPRAGISMRTNEVFRSVGLGAAVKDAGWLGGAPMYSVFKEQGVGNTTHRAGLPPRYSRMLQTCSPVDSRLVLTQDRLQDIALGALRRLGGTVWFGSRVVDVRTVADRVKVTVLDEDSGARSELSARYVVAADGANSDIREALGVTVPDREVVTRLNTAFFRANLDGALQDWGTHMCFVRNDAVYATLLSKNGRDMWSSHIMDYPGKPEQLCDLSGEKTIELLRSAIGDETVSIELLAVNAWEAAIGVAATFRSGRVFLVGDAAHIQSSAGGLGMNTGIQDGHNIAWKIAAVLHGEFSPKLLDTYESERRAAATASLTLSRGLHRGYMTRDGDPNSLYEKVAVDYLRGMMFYGYPPNDSAETAVLDDAVVVGHRLPHRWLEVAGKGVVSTLDLSGARWTVFSGSDAKGWRALADSLPLDLQVHEVPVVDDSALVRPDGFVAWHGTTPESCRAALGELGLACS